MTWILNSSGDMCSILAQFWVCACVCQWACTMVKINWCRVSFVLQMKRFFQQCSCSIYRIPFLFRSEWEVYDKIKVLLKYRRNCILTRAFRCCHVVVNSILSKLEMVSCEKWCSPVGRMEFHFTLHQKSAASLVFWKKMIASSFSSLKQEKQNCANTNNRGQVNVAFFVSL